MSAPFLVRTGLALAVLAASAAEATNGYLQHGYGVKSKGAAGVAAALPQDALVIATNPAGLTAVDDGLELGLELFAPDRTASIEGNAFGPDQSFNGNGTDLFWIPELGFARRVCDDITLGVAVYGNGGMNTDYDHNPYARWGSQGRSYMDLAQLFVSPAAAWRLSERNTIGLAVNLAYQRFDLKGISVFAPFSQSPADVTNNGHDHSWGAGVRIGWLGELTDRLTLGASWQSKTYMSEFDRYSGLFAEQGDFDVPENYVLGAAFALTPATTVALDWQTIKYNDVAAVGNNLQQLWLGNPLGSDDGPGFGWEDMSVLKFAVVHELSGRLTLRAGYSHGDQPIPREEMLLNIIAPGLIEDHVSLGASWALDAKNEISVAYTHAFEHEVHGKGSIPPMLGGGEASASLAEDSFGIAWSLAF